MQATDEKYGIGVLPRKQVTAGATMPALGVNGGIAKSHETIAQPALGIRRQQPAGMGPIATLAASNGQDAPSIGAGLDKFSSMTDTPGPIASLAMGKSEAKQPAIGNRLDPTPTIPGAANVQPGPISALAATGAGNAETVAMNPPGLGVRKIVKDGSTTYTNDPKQAGGVQLNDGNSRGTLSIIGDPRTEGMNQAQAAEYWNSISAGIDAKARQREMDEQISANIVQPGDSIGTIQAKRMNTQSLMKQVGVQAESDIARNKASQAEALANFQETRRDDRQQRNLEAQDARLFAQLDSRERMQSTKDEAATKAVTPAQAANNQEVLLARRRLSGVSMDDIKAKTQQYLPNGRENPAFDPTLTATWRAANQRMVGEDPAFDDFSQKLSNKPAANNPAPAKQLAIPDRFKSDPAMREYTMGTVTPRGYEVKDANGNLVGYYQ